MRGRKDMEEKAKTSQISEELREWQARLNESDAKWSKEVEKMNEREAVYNARCSRSSPATRTATAR